LQESGIQKIHLCILNAFDTPSIEEVRVIEVPLDLSADGDIEIASISDSKNVLRTTTKISSEV
jgi:hypothetical protein